MDEGLERWIYTTANRNFWRVSSWYTREDLVQDGFMCYLKCLKRYERLKRNRKPKKDHRRNFMALVKRTFENHIHTLASRRTDTPERAISQIHHVNETSEAWLNRWAPAEAAIADLTVILHGAPQELKDLLVLLSHDATDGIALYKTKVRLGHRYLGKLTHLNPKQVDIMEMLRQYFQTQATR